MKKIMWAIYTTKASKFPREIYDRSKDATCRLEELRKVGVRWGLIQRVELDFKKESAFDIYKHNYKRI